MVVYGSTMLCCHHKLQNGSSEKYHTCPRDPYYFKGLDFLIGRVVLNLILHKVKLVGFQDPEEGFFGVLKESKTNGYYLSPRTDIDLRYS